MALAGAARNTLWNARHRDLFSVYVPEHARSGSPRAQLTLELLKRLLQRKFVGRRLIAEIHLGLPLAGYLGGHDPEIDVAHARVADDFLRYRYVRLLIGKPLAHVVVVRDDARPRLEREDLRAQL